MAPNSPACSFIHASMAGSRSTAPLNRSNSVLSRHGIFRATCSFQGARLSRSSRISPFSASVPHLYFFYTFAQSRRLPPSCYFPPRSINMDTRQGSQSTASRAREIKPADGRDLSAGKRSAASRARRERHDSRTEPPARASADNRIRIVTPSEPALAPTSFPPSLLPWPPLSHQITRHTLPSKFRRISLKTKKSGTHKVTHKLRLRPDRVRRGGRPEGRESPGSRLAIRASTVPNYSTHVSSKFRPISLKTEKSRPGKVQQNFEASLLCRRRKSAIKGGLTSGEWRYTRGVPIGLSARSQDN